MQRSPRTHAFQSLTRGGREALLTAALALASVPGTRNAFAQGQAMKIRLHVDGQIVMATLDDTPTARDFAKLLPLSLTLKDYARIERIADLPRKLSVTGAPPGHTPSAGELTYYAPWGNLAIFLDANVHAHGLVRLGQVDSGLTALQRPGPFEVRIEPVPD